MPYAVDHAGIYRIVDLVTGTCYVGQSKRLKKRIAEHFRLLNLGTHPNPHLQGAFDRSGPKAFRGEVEVLCEDSSDMDAIEGAFLTGEAWFGTSQKLFNISTTARAPMSGRGHTDETRARISAKKRGGVDHVTPEYRDKLAAAQRHRYLSDPEFVRRVKFIVQNPQLSYAERGRRIGLDTSSTRKLALKYSNLKEPFDG
jgi:group I intron endonuclease